MKVIELPEDVEIRIAAEDDEPIERDGRFYVQKFTDKCSMKRFLQMAIYAHEPFGKGISNIRIGSRLLDKIEKAKEKLELEDGHYKMLKEAVEAFEQLPRAAMKWAPFYEAVGDAKG